jgi:hypothetical protein
MSSKQPWPKGPHQSALTPESKVLIAEDVAYQVKAGYAEIISWKELGTRRPKNLKVSPLAVVPQRKTESKGTHDPGPILPGTLSRVKTEPMNKTAQITVWVDSDHAHDL